MSARKFIVDAAQAREAAKRGSAGKVARYMVEGEYVTHEIAAARLGVDVKTVQRRVSNARKMPGPITWARLA